jgi:hypothetical protein
MPRHTRDWPWGGNRSLVDGSYKSDANFITELRLLQLACIQFMAWQQHRSEDARKALAELKRFNSKIFHRAVKDPDALMKQAQDKLVEMQGEVVYGFEEV